MACGSTQEEEEAVCGKPSGYKKCIGLKTYIGLGKEKVDIEDPNVSEEAKTQYQQDVD